MTNDQQTMMARKRSLAIFNLLVLAVCGGSSCPRFMDVYPAPRVLPRGASLAEVAGVINDNSDRIQSLQTSSAYITVPGAPRLRANLAVERPSRLRLQARMFSSPEVDLGSNDELFWFWVPRSDAALFYCRHDQFHTSTLRNSLPVEPQWLIEALGMTRLDPALPHQGPTDAGAGRLRIVTPVASGDRPLTRVTIVDEARGWVLEQHLYDARDMLVASARASRHYQDPASQVVLPGQVEIEWPATQFSMKLDLRNVVVNQLAGNPEQLWSPPPAALSNSVDLGAAPPY